jgi:polar amino acid transport system substrate-binding protein
MRRLPTLVILTLALILAAPAMVLAADCLETVKAKKELVIGTSADYPPFESLNEKNEIVGFDVDLVNLVAKELGVTAKIVNVGFDGLVPSLLAGKIDGVAAGLTENEERKKSVDYTIPYVSGPNVIVTRKDTMTIKTPADMAGKKVAVQIGSTQEKIATDAKADVKSYNLYTEAAMAVLTKQAQAMVVHEIVAKAFVREYPELAIAGELPQLNIGMVFRKDCPELRTAVNAALEKFQKAGTINELAAKWFK